MPHAASPLARTRSFLLWAVAISIALHLAIAPLVLRLKSAAPETEVAQEPLQLSTPLPRAVPTPPPATPTPRPVTTPKPVAATPAPRAMRPVARSRPRASRPQRSVAPPSHAVAQTAMQAGAGTSPGADSVAAGGGATATEPGGIASSPVATMLVPATPSPIVATPTPKPVCAQPNVDARMVARVDPEYPEIPRSQGISGTVTIEVALEASGDVRSAAVLRSSGNAALDGAALRSARESRYAAEISNCESVAGSYLFVAEFETQ